jgi:hypothetical protein
MTKEKKLNCGRVLLLSKGQKKKRKKRRESMYLGNK